MDCAPPADVVVISPPAARQRDVDPCDFGWRSGAKGSKKSKKDAGKNEESDIFKIVKMVMERNFDPVRPHQALDPTLFFTTSSGP